MTAVADTGGSRVKKALLNAKVNFIFYGLTLLASFVARKVFLDHLGDNFIGLTGTLLNILGYLNLAELGISSAISFNLYKPILENNREKILEVVSLLGYYYRNIGLIVAAAGVFISFFLYFIFKDSTFTDFGVIYFAYYSFLISALLGYFMNYRQLLLVADQRNYIVISLFQSSNILKACVQIAVAIYYQNFYAWISIELIFSIIYSIALNIRISKFYPWLKSKVKIGKKANAKYPEILKSTKQIFIHKIKDFLLTQSDQLFVFIFVSLKMVAYYGNYLLITSKVMQLFSQLLDSVLASVGNLVAENNRSKMLKVFWELMAVRYVLAGFLAYAVYHLIDPFITLWVGEEYLLSRVVVILLVVNLFIFVSRGTVDNFNFAFGHFSDVWAAWVELILNVGITVAGGYFWGIPGILLGKTVSLLIIVVLWKPYYLFSSGFHLQYGKYWQGTIKYIVSFILCVLISEGLLHFFSFNPSSSIINFIIFAIMVSCCFGLPYAALVILVCPGGRNLLERMKRR